MKIKNTGINGLYIIEPLVFADARGYFFESYNKKKIEDKISTIFVQDNQSKSSYGVIRGLHYQLNPHAQTKLVRVLFGSILDVVVDLRRNSDTFGKVFSIELSEENKLQLYIPKGFAHGFSVLSETAVVLYKCDELYNPDYERGITYNDPAFNIDWKIEKGKEVISGKDAKLPTLDNAEFNF